MSHYSMFSKYSNCRRLLKIKNKPKLGCLSLRMYFASSLFSYLTCNPRVHFIIWFISSESPWVRWFSNNSTSPLIRWMVTTHRTLVSCTCSGRLQPGSKMIFAPPADWMEFTRISRVTIVTMNPASLCVAQFAKDFRHFEMYMYSECCAKKLFCRSDCSHCNYPKQVMEKR